MELVNQDDNTDVDFRRVIYPGGDLHHCGLSVSEVDEARKLHNQNRDGRR